MKTINYLCLSLFIFFHLLSCNDYNSLNYKSNITLINCDFIKFDEFIGKADDIFLCDTLLIYYDYYDGTIYSAYDVKNDKFKGRFLSRGNGPNEVTLPIDILSYKDSELYTYQRNTAIINSFELSEFKMLDNIKMTNEINSAQLIKAKDYYIGFGVFNNGRFGIYNSEAKLLYECGLFPYIGEDMNKASAFLMYQGHSCANPDSNYFATGCTFSDNISFYEIHNNEVIKLNEYSSFDANVRIDNNSMKINDDCTIGYMAAFGTANYCYMLYCGKTLGECKNKGYGNEYIIIFDWKGDYIRTLKSDYRIIDFCVDEINSTIYAIVLDQNGECEIAKFKY